MANDLTQKTLHGVKQNIVHEGKFSRFLRKISELNHKKWPLAVFSPLFAFIGLNIAGLDYLYAIFISFFIALFIIYIRKFYKPKLEDLHIVGIGGLDPKKVKYYMKLGDATRSIDLIRNPAIVHSQTPEVLDYPVLVDFDMSLRHMFVVGTTGSGKTTFLIFLLKQHLALGGGAIIVDGKGDKDIFTAVVNTCIHTNREDDFHVINFNVPKESNTMNPLLVGTADDIIDIIGNMLETGGDNAFWAGRALSMMKGMLSLIVPLREADKMYDPSVQPVGSKHIPILTFKVLNKFLDLENLRGLYFYIKDEWNKDSRNDFIDTSRMEGYLSSCSVPLADAKAKLSDGMTKMHGNSNTMWGEALDLFMGTFGEIFDTDSPDIDMNDIVRNSRVLYILLPATKKDPRTLSMLGKIILAFFKSSVATLLGDTIAGTIEERKASSAIRPKVPFWGVMDEYGAYATEGFDNVLAQARSLRVSISIMVQETASLETGSGMKDKKRLLGNTGVKVFLKIEEQETVEEVVKFFGEEEQAVVKYANEKADDLSYEIQRKPLITTKMMKDMGGGHGYVAFSGHITPILAGFYEPPNARYIQEFLSFRETTIVNYLVKKMNSDFKTKYFDEALSINDIEKQAKINRETKKQRRTKEMTDKFGSVIGQNINILTIIENIEKLSDQKTSYIDMETVANRMELIIEEINGVDKLLEEGEFGEKELSNIKEDETDESEFEDDESYDEYDELDSMFGDD